MSRILTLVFLGLLSACGGEPTLPKLPPPPPPPPIVAPTPTPTPAISTPTPTPTPECPGGVCPVPTPDPSEEILYATGYIPNGKPGLAKNSPFMLADRIGELPVKFSWVDAGFDVPVRNQGFCGACWAVATATSVEFGSKIFLDKAIQYSPQFLLSRLYFGCQGGQFAGEDVVENGLPTEAECPYLANTNKCPDTVRPAIKGIRTVNIGAEGRTPTVIELKEALLQWGPFTAAVSYNSAWKSYKGGIMEQCGSSNLNHLVVIHGWDDTLGKAGAWKVRNSHGKKFGVNGDILLPFGCSRIADEAAAVILK